MKNIKYVFIVFGISFIGLSFNTLFKVNDFSDIIIVLKSQVETPVVSGYESKEDKSIFVFNETKKRALDSQERIIQFLKSNELNYKSFHIINAISVKDISNDLLEQLNDFSEIDYIQNDNFISLIHKDRFITNNYFSRNIEWGIEKIGANKVWEEFGIKGKGAVVGGQDTGYDWQHQALINSYRGWDGNTADHNYNWHDAIHEYNPMHATEDNVCGLDVLEPCDDGSHGTHTMGTMVGLAENTEIGVAPEAKWMACRNMERGYGKPSTYIECFEWFLAPTDLNGNNPDPTKSPHVINNSWSCPEIEGCNLDNFNTMKIVVDNLKAAGIVVVVSAGNSGVNGCESINTPSAIFESSFSVGASNSSDVLANFSSLGAIAVDGSMRTKPNVSAPGVGVKSCIPNGYGTSSGTSMAGPHVVGAVALIISANPKLAGQVEQIETILEQTAVPITANTQTCNGTNLSDIPNNIFGYGRIDVYAAVKLAMSDAFNYDEQGVFVYPNPSNAVFQFLIPNFKGNAEAQISIWDASGRLVLENDISFNENRGSLDLSNASNGVYYYRIKQAENSFCGKLLKL